MDFLVKRQIKVVVFVLKLMQTVSSLLRLSPSAGTSEEVGGSGVGDVESGSEPADLSTAPKCKFGG